MGKTVIASGFTPLSEAQAETLLRIDPEAVFFGDPLNQGNLKAPGEPEEDADA